MSELPPLVDATWVLEPPGAEELVLGECRGSKVHYSRHKPRSNPIALG